MSKLVRFAILMLFLQFSHIGWTQISSNPSTSGETPVYVEGFDYPSFDPVSNFAWFKVHFPIGKTTEFIVGGEHFRTYFADRAMISAEFKQYFAQKAFLIGGYQLEFDLLNNGEGSPNTTPRREVFIGMGYEVQPNFLMEAKLVTPLGDPEFDSIGLEGVGTRLQVGTRFKF